MVRNQICRLQKYDQVYYFGRNPLSHYPTHKDSAEHRERLKIKDRISEVLEKVGLSTKGFKMPHELSGGEQQRIVIARALLNDPEIILADEPTGNLDPETSEGIMRLLFDLSKTERAVLMATHNYPIIEKFPARIIRCEGGKIIDSKEMVNMN